MSLYRRNYGIHYTLENYETSVPSQVEDEVDKKKAESSRLKKIIANDINDLFDELSDELKVNLGYCGRDILEDKETQDAISIALAEWIDNYITTRFGTNQELKDQLVDVGSRIVQKIVTNALYDIFGPLDENYITPVESAMDNMKSEMVRAVKEKIPTQAEIKQNFKDALKDSKPALTRMLNKTVDELIEKKAKPFMNSAEDMIVDSVRKAIKEMADQIKRKILEEIGYYDAKEYAYEAGDVATATVMEAGAALEGSGKAVVDWAYDAGDWVKDASGAGVKAVQVAETKAKQAAQATYDAARSVASTVSSWFSDPRLKYDIKLIGKSPSGINIYSYKLHEYRGLTLPGIYQGVMSDEVPWASFKDDNGYEMVDYNKVDVEFKRIK
jgi:hypothetical protein